MMASKRKPRKRSTIKNADAIDRIDKMVPLIIENVRIAIKLESALETGNEVVREIRGDAEHGSHWYGADCYNTVINSVTLNLALTLARLFDPGRKRMHPNKRDVASIPLLLRLIKQKRCRSALAKRARDWTPRIAGMASLHEATVLREIDAAVAVYTGLMSNHKGRSAAATLKGFRDKKLAHSLIDTVLKLLPRFEQLFLLLNTAMEITAHTRLTVIGENWEPEDFRREGRRQGKAFWEPAIRAVIEAEKNSAGRGLSPRVA